MIVTKNLAVSNIICKWSYEFNIIGCNWLGNKKKLFWHTSCFDSWRFDHWFGRRRHRIMGSYIESDYQYLPDLFSSLTDVLCENRQFYLENNGARKGEEFAQCFEELLGVTTKTLKLLLEVAAVSPLFDYDPHIKGNGYRTIVRVIEICFRRIFALGKDFQENRTGLFFRSDHHYKELFSYLQLSKGLFRFLEFTKLILEWSVGNDLFPPENCLEAKKMTERHLHEMEKECFYGRRLGFYVSNWQPGVAIQDVFYSIEF